MGRWIGLLLACVLAVGVSQPASAQQAKEVRIALQPGVLFLPIWMVKQDGLIEKQAARAGYGELKVNWLNTTSGGANIDALLSDNVDVVSGGVTNLLVVWAKSKGAVKGFAAVSGVPNELLTRDPNVRSLKDFSEKNRIAVPTLKMSTQAVFLAMALEKAFGDGAHTRFDSLMVQLGHPQATLSLMDERNPVDSHFSGPPFMQAALKKPGIRSVLSSLDIVGESTSLLAYTSARFYRANPKVIDIVVAALDEANQIIRQDPKKAAELYLAGTGEKYTVDDIMSVIATPGTLFTTVPTATAQYAAFMNKVGLVDQKAASWKDFFFANIHSANGS